MAWAQKGAAGVLLAVLVLTILEELLSGRLAPAGKVFGMGPTTQVRFGSAAERGMVLNRGSVVEAGPGVVLCASCLASTCGP